ncbi:MAG: hypothetical protein KatS3mg129_0851 [Leptospiraceae bacterium]|nr:MAG: hypothetical protein KatS3mg129_0851 [Leptospiraceae bacterium]
MDIEKTNHMNSNEFSNSVSENFEDINQNNEEIKLKIQNLDDVSLPEYRELDSEEIDYYRGLLEAILFLANEPLSVSVLARQIQLDKTNTRILLDSLMDEYLERNSGIVLKEIAGGYRFVTSEKYADVLKKIFKPKNSEKLSRSLLETLAIICYKQPITLPEIEEIRGVNSRAMVSALLQKNLIKPQGYKSVPGRPTLYVTTKEFLIKFNLSSLADLPPLKDLKELPLDDLDNLEEE